MGIGQDEVTAMADSAEQPWSGRRGPIRRFRARLRQHPLLNTTWRLAVFTTGSLVGIAGLVMLITPGPGMAAVIVGLAILATEFMWARHALRQVRRWTVQARRKAHDTRVRFATQLITAMVALAILAGVAGYLWWFGFTIPWPHQ